MKLSDDFTFDEMTFSDTAVRHGIKNLPNAEQMENLQILCEKCLQPIRDYFNKPIRISSGFRNLTVNSLVGGSKSSQHLEGKAADFTIIGVDLREAFEVIMKNFEYDQLILEFNSWIHISYSNLRNRREAFLATKIKGRTVYERL